MKIRLMRFVDYGLGVPLCFLLSGINLISRFFSFFIPRKVEHSTPQKILFIKLSEMGTTVLAYPLLKRMEKEYPTAERFFLTFERNRGVLDLLNGVVPHQNVLTINETSVWGFVRDTFKIIERLRGEKINIVFDLEFFSRFTAILTWLSHATKRIGFYRYTFEGLYRGNLLTHKIQYNPMLHISRMYLSLAEEVGKEKKSSPEMKGRADDSELSLPKFTSSADARKRIEDRLGQHSIDEKTKLYLINPGEGMLSLREWPLEHIVALLKKILVDQNSFILIVGTERGSNKADGLLHEINNERCINWLGQTSLLELLELFNRADALIINDCGLAHLASLTSIQQFIFFGPESPRVFAPLGENKKILYADLPCSPCLSVFNHRNSACQDNLCLKGIKPDDIYNVISNTLRINPDQERV